VQDADSRNGLITGMLGNPCLGKSALLTQLAATLAIQLQDVRALLLDPVDLRAERLKTSRRQGL